MLGEQVTPDIARADSEMPGSNEPEVSNLVQLQIAQAVTNQKVEEVGRLVTDLRNEVRELKSNFATKNELKALEDEVAQLRNWNKWVVQIVGGLILAAIVGMILVKGGVPRP